MWWLIGIGVSSVLILLLILPFFLPRRRGPHTVSEAVSNARQIGFPLFEFETEYGKFPDRSTIAAVRGNTGSALTLTDRTSNDLFAQLLVAEMAVGERLFYARAKSMRRPDDVFHTDATILEHGECAFAYISGLSSTRDPSTPILFGPVIPGTTTLDRESCDGKAVVLRLDNSVTTLPINRAGKILDHGLDLLDPRQPYWHGKAPDVKWPK
jgi:hypothetical protein